VVVSHVVLIPPATSETQVKRMRSIISDSFERATAIPHYEVAHSKRDASLELLVRELQHRIRNLLTVVQCFVNSTEAGTADDYRVALMARIANLSDAYSLIESARENRVSLAELLDRTLKPHVTFLKDRLFAAGPDIVLEPRLALSLHMIFHELATNASKHGALTSTSGAVEVLWDLRSDGEDHALAVQWREHGGPEVHEPRHKGFGLRLISKVLSGAHVEMDFAPAGLLCRLLVKIDPS
jgi:two-component sensor histidine kinase